MSLSITLFFIDGEPTGRLKCSLSNRINVAYKIPRSMLSQSRERKDLEHTGLYMLIGKADDEYTDKVYVGEGEKVLRRILQHPDDEEEWDDWTECLVLISSDDSLNKAHIKYLENSIFLLLKKADRCLVTNGKKPEKSSLSEEDIGKMEEYLFYLRLLTSAMGYRFLEPIMEKSSKSEFTDYYLQGTKAGYNARGNIVPEGFVILKESIVSDDIADKFRGSGYHVLRERLVSDKSIINNKFTKDVLFNSYSAAAAVVLGRSANGRIEWKTLDGITLNENEQRKSKLEIDIKNEHNT